MEICLGNKLPESACSLYSTCPLSPGLHHCLVLSAYIEGQEAGGEGGKGGKGGKGGTP